VPPPPKSIKGRIKLNGNFYDANCKCATEDSVSACKHPQSARVFLESANRGGGVPPNALRDVLGRPSDVVMVNAGEESPACSDPRVRGRRLGVPGGTFGEFLNALTEYENVLDSPLTYPQVVELVERFVSTSDLKLYACTDTASVLHLERTVSLNGVFPGAAASCARSSRTRAATRSAPSSLPTPPPRSSR
jgi:hypothetical protein